MGIATRGSHCVVVLTLHLQLAVQIGQVVAGRSNEDCLSLGFSDSLECSTCEKLQEVVPDLELYQECRDCCRVVNVESMLYDEAKLQICD